MKTIEFFFVHFLGLFWKCSVTLNAIAIIKSYESQKIFKVLFCISFAVDSDDVVAYKNIEQKPKMTVTSRPTQRQT